jgi:hypothetical protein
MSDCGFFKDVKVEATATWVARHEGHGGEVVKDYPEPQPPGYRLAFYHCTCGCKESHVAVEEAEHE